MSERNGLRYGLLGLALLILMALLALTMVLYLVAPSAQQLIASLAILRERRP